MSRWFRHYAGMMRDDKLVRVAIRTGQAIERVLWIWGAILESAAEIDDNGRYDFDAAEAAYFLRADEADILAVVAALEGSGRLDQGSVAKWGDRQFSSDRSADRQRRYRERKKGNDGAGDGEYSNRESHRDDRVTSRSRHGDAPETETETYSVSNETDAKVVVDPEKVMFDSGVALITSCGKPESAARSWLGKAKREHGAEAVIVMIGRAKREGAPDPIAFMEGGLRSGARARASPEFSSPC